MRIALLVDEPDVHDAVLGRVRLLHVLEIRLLVDVEVRVDGARPRRRVVSTTEASTRLPAVTIARDTRPAIGAVTRVNDRSSSAASSAALIDASCAAATVASAATLLDLLLRRRVAREQPLARDRDTTAASLSCASARSRSAVRRSTSALNGRGSI